MPSDAQVLLQQAASWQARGERVAVATVVKTWGSSPRPPGSLLCISETGQFVGSVSGGCIEGAVIGAAQEAMADGQPRLLEFGVTNDMAWEVGLACGGQVQVFVRPLATGGGDAELDRQLLAALLARRSVVLVTTIPDGIRQLISEDVISIAPSAALPADLHAAVTEALASDRPVELTAPSGEAAGSLRYFVQPFCAPSRLLIIGAVHIAQPLSQLAAIAGFEVIIIDPRTAFASEDRFPGVERLTTWPGPALSGLGLDRRSAVVTLTHDPKLDDPALEAALRSPAFYIGSLGSGKTHSARLQRLRSRGFSDADLTRIHGPVGLKISARSPAEIAVSILAELVAVLRGAGT
ncbi:MAG TPA: XdhC family protein [Pseudomonadota bacterium]|nr:XdhC family protein [Pseudomonadota bacterium]